MPHSAQSKTKAINLRKKGLSYREIERTLNIPETTLSYWLHSIKLTPDQQIKLKISSTRNLTLASAAHTRKRLEKTQEIINQAKRDIHNLNYKDLWYMGIMLYWAEGNKQKEHNPSTGIIFSNSDPNIIKLFLKWLKKCIKTADNQVVFEIYIHKTYQKTISKLSHHWSKITGFPIEKFQKVYFKKNKVHSYRKNRGPQYNGVLRISVLKSTDLNRKITGWVQGICQEFLS